MSLDGFRLAPQQRRLWQLGQDGSVLRASGAFLLTGELSDSRLEPAVARLVARHEILRTGFERLAVMDVPIQAIRSQGGYSLAWIDLSALAEPAQEACVLRLLEEQGGLPFDPRDGTGCRFVVAALAPRRHALLVSMPALMADAESLWSLAGELVREMAPAGEDGAEATPVQFVQFSEWQNELLAIPEEGTAFWRQRLATLPASPALPFEAAPIAGTAFAPVSLAVPLEPELAAAVARLAAGLGVTSAAVFLAAWQALLHRLSGQRTIAVFLGHHGRVYEEMRQALGPYVRWGPVRTTFHPGLPFGEAVAEAGREAREGADRQEYLEPWEGLDGVAFESFDWPAVGAAGGVRVSPLAVDADGDRFKLKLSVLSHDGRWQLRLRYDRAFYGPAAVERLAGRWRRLLAGAVALPITAVDDLPLLDAAEERRLLVEWNRTAVSFEDDACIHQLFSRQAARTPHAVALVAGEERLTFAELDRRANRLAHRLRRLGAQPETRVAFCLERSAELLVALLAILKADAAYLPLDPALPPARLSFMLEDSGAVAVVTRRSLLSRLAALPAPVAPLLLDEEDGIPAVDGEPDPPVRACPESLAYVLYTSGSTGRPKAVAVQHRSVVNLAHALDLAVYAGSEPSLAVGLNAPLSFDSSVKQVLQLLRGHTLYLVPEEVRADPEAMVAALGRWDLDALDCTPSQLRALLAAGLLSLPRGLPRRLLIGGEAIGADLWQSLACHPGLDAFNVYGPTECTVDTTVARLHDVPSRPVLGRPIANGRLYLLDGRQAPVPAEAPGEICIGGAGLARGYLGRPELTAERFIPDGLSGGRGERLYRSGDLARFLPDGGLEFLGRVDHQVKVRGFRVELGEIEAVLAEQPGVVESVVVAREEEPGQPHLVAYVVGAQRGEAAFAELRERLRERLPEHMVPAVFVSLGALPLNRHGKVDRAALPAPEETPVAAGGEPPASPFEQVLATLYAEVLGRDRVGVEESFFDLGGHSLLATQLISRAQRAFAVDVPLRALFESPSVRQMAHRIEALKAGGERRLPALAGRPHEGPQPLSFAQERLWFLHQLEPASPFYNCAGAAWLSGPLAGGRLAVSLAAIVARHEVLRTRFTASSGLLCAVVSPAAALEVPLLDLSALPPATRRAQALQLSGEEARRPFDLAGGALLRALMVRLAPDEHLLLFTMHHIVSDAWSLGVLLREVIAFYEADRRAPAPLPPLPVQYADFARWQREWLAGEVLAEELGYWRERLVGAAVLDLPSDRPRPALRSYRGGTLRASLSPELSAELSALSRRHEVTPFMALLAVFTALLARYSGQEDVSVGTPIAGRTLLETEGLIGFFINTLVLRTDLAGNPDLPGLLRQVRETTLGAYSHQAVPFERLVEELRPERSLSQTPLFQVMFAFQDLLPGQLTMGEVAVEPFAVETGSVKFDLELVMSEDDGALVAGLEYSTELFQEATARRLLAHLEALLRAVVAQPEGRLWELSLLTAAEKRQVAEWNRTRWETPPGGLLDRIGGWAARRPQAVAIAGAGEELTYGELWRRSQRVAAGLLEGGLRPEEVVALLGDRSPDFLVAMLGIWRAGGVYLPLDLEHPPQRLAVVLEQSGARRVVSTRPAHEALEKALERLGGRVEQVPLARLAATSDARPPSPPRSELAYVIFTSGSTGRPKGAMVEHRGMLNHLWAKVRDLALDDADVVAQTASQGFDISVWQLLAAPLVGGRVEVFSDEEVREPRELLAAVESRGVTVLEVVPSLLGFLLEEVEWAGEARPRLAALRHLIPTGEALSADLCRRWLAAYPGVALTNAYGPTECSDDVTHWTIAAPPAAGWERVPIGRALPNLGLYVVDRGWNLLPEGVSGELWVGGIGVGRGYLGEPAQTATAFVPDGLSGAAGERLYRTGDRVRWMGEGVLDYLGRLDQQVKVRGFRIELGEIESVLASHPAVRQCAVIVRHEAAEPQLVAYVASDPLHVFQDGEAPPREAIGGWQTVFDEVYRDGFRSSLDEEVNLRVWTSSYTGLPLPEDEILECVEDSVARIRELRPRHLLEIGCGTGLLLSRLAPGCESYCGTDFSAAALGALERRVRERSGLPPVALLCRPAHELADLPRAGFDTVVLNEVVQYFPSSGYLMAVIAGAVRVTEPGGRVFVGGVRSLPLLRAFHLALELHRAAPALPVAEVRRRALLAADREKELVVDPAFFPALAGHLSRPLRVRMQLKGGRGANELTKFRYDVVLELDREPAGPAVARVPWSEVGDLAGLRRLLAGNPERLAVSGVPNARVAAEVAALRLADAAGIATAGELRSAAAEIAGGRPAVDPARLWDLGAELSCRTEVVWADSGEPAEIDVLFTRRDCGLDVPMAAPAAGVARPWSSYTNDPAGAAFRERLVPELRRLLASRLPDYMAPAVLVPLDALPLTPNGKLDRRALPAPDPPRAAAGDEPPGEGPVAELLAQLWTEALGVERIAAGDSFFDLGGHSLLATRLASRIRDVLGVELPIRAFFEHPTFAGLAQRVEAALAGDAAVAAPPLRASGRTEGPLSFAQQRLWVLDQLLPGSTAYNITAAFAFAGPLSAAALARSFTEIVRRHETLRTVFSAVDGQPVQRIAPAAPVELPGIDLAALPAERREAEARRLAQAEAALSFDLAAGPLLRLRLLRLSERAQWVLFTCHHIVADGWSVWMLMREIAALYPALAQGAVPALPELPVQYLDFARWQREWLRGEALASQVAYWRQRLQGAEPALPLPFDHPRPAVASWRAGRHAFELPAAAVEPLRGLARSLGVTLFMVLLAAFKALLARFTASEDISLGVPIANRRWSEIEGLIGFFVNTLVLRTLLAGEMDFGALVRAVRETSLGAYAHQDLPFEKLVDELSPARRVDHNPLFQVVFMFQNAAPEELAIPGLTAVPIALEPMAAKFELSLIVLERPGGLSVHFEHAADLFDASTIGRMADHLQNLLAGAVADPATRLSDLPSLTGAERRQLLEEWSPARPAGPPSACLHELFAEQAARRPEAVAVVHGDELLSYGELDRKADRLAHRLRRLGVGPEAMVALCLERSPRMIVALLAVLKAGGAYVPLEPSYPRDRQAFVLAEIQAPVVITERHLAGALPASRSHVLCLDDEEEGPAVASAGVPASGVDPQSLAYVIYTSGSTGRPKGVLVRHDNVVRLFQSTAPWFGFGEQDVWTLFHSYAFDFSVWEIWGALLFGGRLVIVPYWESRSPEDLLALLRRERVTVLNQTPSAFRQLVHAAGADGATDLRYVVFGGEALDLRSLRPWLAAQGDRSPRLINMYGITETTVHVTYRPVAAADLDSPDGSPIGRALPDLYLRLVDRALQLVPVGAPGELCVGGAGLARGYLQRPDLTAQRFVPDPFGGEPGARLYRSGDLARYRPDGELEYLGRIDHQVKVHGFRIELGEIEAALAAHPGVRAAAAALREGLAGAWQLAAYFVPAGEPAPTAAELRAFLTDRLPGFMVPAFLVRLRELPLSPSGKLDRRTLPAPAVERDGSPAAAEPGTPAERRLAEIWSEVLGVEGIGVTDNFFALGGDSILALQVVARARAAGLRITPRQLFQHQTVAELSLVAQPDAALQEKAEPGPQAGPWPLTPIQSWFFADPPVDAHHFNQAVLLAVPAALSPGALARLLVPLLTQHDALRLRFTRGEAGWSQQPAGLGEEPGPLCIDLSALPVTAGEGALAAAAAALQASLDLERGPLFRATLLQSAAGRRLLLLAHHLVIDSVSWRILLADLQTGWQQLRRGEEPRLPARTSSYQEWSRALVAWANGGALRELAYWRDQAPATALPADFTGENTVASAATCESGLDAEETASFLRAVPETYGTGIQDALLTALVRTLARWTGQPSLVLDLEGHGREEEVAADLDLSRTVGWLTALYPVALSADPHEEPGESLKRIKEQVGRVPGRGLSYGMLRYLAEDPVARRWSAAAAHPEVAFNYLGQLDLPAGDSGLAPAGESHGPLASPRRRRRHCLEIDGRVAGGRLTVTWTYSRNLHRSDRIEALASELVAELRLLLAHCRSCRDGAYTPSDFPALAYGQEDLDRLIAGLTGFRSGEEKRFVEDVYPLSPTQQGILYHHLETGDPALYLTQVSYELRGELDAAALAGAWRETMRRQPVLRTGLVWDLTDEPLQVVYRHAALPWREEDWRALPSAEQRRRLEELLRSDREIGFDLRRPPLLRLTLIRLADDVHRLIWSHHHVLLDGWSYPLVLSEVLAHYAAATGGRQPALAPVRPYRDFIVWLRGRDRPAAEAFWRRALVGMHEPTPLAFEPLEDGPAAAPRDHLLRLSTAATAALRRLASEHQLTLSTVVEGAWGLLLARYSGEAEPVLGVTVAGRPAELPGVETMLGLFINTVPLPIPVLEREMVARWLQGLQQWQAELRQYEHTPLTEIRGCSPVPAGKPLFETILVFENYPVDESLRLRDAAFTVGDVRFTSRTNYPVSLVVAPGLQLLLRLTCDPHRWGPVDAERALRHLGALLDGFTQRPAGLVEDCSLLTAQERHQLCVEWNDSAAAGGGDRLVHRRFEAAARRSPDALAVVAADGALTYGELNRRANRLARSLRALGVTPDQPVALCLERATGLIVALLAVLKAGGAFLPLDPEQPAERLKALLDQAGCEVLITSESQRPALAHPRCTALSLDLAESALADYPEGDLEAVAGEQSLAYVIFTSGSTGLPKGVAVEHRQIVSYVDAVLARLGLESGASFAAVSTIAADLGHTSLFGALCQGGCLHLIAAPEATSGAAFAAYLERHPVDVLKIVPSHFAALQSGAPGSLLPRRALVLGGEALRWGDLQRFADAREPHAAGPALWNHYGPTETTVGVLAHRAGAPGDGPRSLTVPLGRPLANRQIHLLDRALRPVPAGVVGELFIGGDGVARGYLGRPELTAERFVPDPFSPGARLYRTGDRARWLRDGTIEFLGRVDRQVKVRGFRIEPGEIEALLSSLPQVADCVVAAPLDEHGDRRLVAYCVPAAGGEGVAEELRRILRLRLPAPMVPAYIVLLPRLPLTANGKVDVNALPPVDPAPAEVARAEAPRTAVEDLLAGLWAEVLGRASVGIHQGWFELGGHSLLAMRLMARIGRAFGVALPLRDLFEAFTVAALAVRVEAAMRAGRSVPGPLVPQPRNGPWPLSFAQQRLWLHDQLEPGDPAYNCPAVLRLRGALDLGALAAALREVTRRHEVLRATFPALSGQPAQVVDGGEAVRLPLVDLTGLPDSRREAEGRRLVAKESLRGFDLARGPLLRVCVLRLAPVEHLGLLIVHHIATDAWSTGILIRELSVLYDAGLGGHPSPLPDLPVQYADYAAWQRRWLQGEVLAEHLAYWRERLATAPPVSLPADFPRRQVAAGDGAVRTFALPAELGEGVRRISRSASVTPFMVLLTAWSVLLGRWTGRTDVVTGTAVAGRGRIETENLIGFFINLLPVRVDLSGSPRAIDLLGRVRDAALGAYAYQELPFEKLIEELRPERERSRTPLFAAAFSLDNVPREELSLSGLAVEPVEMRPPTARFDLTVWVRERPDGFWVDWTYRPGVFRPATIDRLAAQLAALVRDIVERPEGRVLMAKESQQTREEQQRDRQSDAQSLHHVRRRRLVQQTASAMAGDPADEEMQDGK
jgi:amino acid adenylation domain-containing protein/non-ribosomal peptide synthase protein (TIGR01720 family)